MRKTDTIRKPRFRSDDRFFCQDEQWYFETREGNDQGPFESRCEAEFQLERYIAAMKILNESSRSKDIDWEDVTVENVKQTPD